MLFPKLPTLSYAYELKEEIGGIEIEDVHYHRIAVSNLDDIEQRLKRLWYKRYHIAPKPLDEYTYEELYIEWLEDYYEAHPKEAAAIRDTSDQEIEGKQEEWDGELPEDKEKERQEYWKKRMAKNPHLVVDMNKFKSDEAMTPEKAKAYLDAVGRSGPPTFIDKPTEKRKAPEEFEEEY